MVVEQIIDVPPSRRIILDLPPDLSVNKVRVSVFPVTEKQKTGKALLNKRATPHTDALLSILSGIGDIDPDEIRAERLAKHLK